MKGTLVLALLELAIVVALRERNGGAR